MNAETGVICKYIEKETSCHKQTMKKISEHTIIGIAACAAVFICFYLFAGFLFGGFGKKTQFNTYSQIENDEIRLTADNIDAGDFMGGDISNISRDRNDSIGSSEDWAENEYEGNPRISPRMLSNNLLMN